MKKNTNVSFLLFLLLVSLFVSCKNFINSIIDSTPETESQSVESQTEKKYATITGAITVEGAVPSEIADALSGSKNAESNARSAGITYTASDYTFYIHATNSSGSSPAEVDASSGTFTINLEYGTWTLYAYAKNNFDKKTYFKSASYTQIINEDCSILSHDFVVRPMTGAGGEGKILLRLFTSNDIDVFTYCIGIPGVDSSNSLTGISGGGKKYSPLSVDSCPSGSYTVQFIFKDGSGDIVYATTQVINVYDGFTTDTWIDNGGNDGLISNGEFTLTDTLVKKFVMSTFYVDGVNGSDSNSGTWVKPFKTVAKAVAYAKKSTVSGTKNIYVKAGGSEEVSASIDLTKDINIEVYTDTIGDKKGKYTLKRNDSLGTSPIISNSSASAVTVNLTGLIIDGNSKTVGASAGGISIRSSGTFILNNCEIINNYVDSSYDGAGIYNNGNLTINDTIFYNNSARYGGGIYDSGSLTISGSTWFETSSDIYLFNGKTITVNGTLSPKDKDGNSVTTTAYLTLHTAALTPTPTTAITSESALDWDTVNKFNVTNESGKYCVKVNSSDSKKGVLAERGANGTVGTYTPEVYSITIDKTSGIPGVENTINFTIKDTAENVLENQKCTFEIYQNGDCIQRVEDTTEMSLTIPRWYQPDTYKIKVYTTVNGFKFDRSFDYKILSMISIQSVTGVPAQNVYCSSKEDLEKLQQLVNSNIDFTGITVYLTQTIDFENSSFSGIGAYGSPIKYFTGTFDGLGNTIKNINIRHLGSGSPGVFEYIKDATIKNLTVTGSGTGGIVNRASGECRIQNCISYLNIAANSDLGGIIGTIYNNTIVENCINYGSINYAGSYGGGETGGICYYMQGGIIRNCINFGKITADSAYSKDSGGIVGCVWQGTVENCYNAGIVENSNYSGGIVGRSKNTTLKNNVNYGSLSGHNVKGILGTTESGGSISITNNFYSNSYSESRSGCYSFDDFYKLTATLTTGSYTGVDIVSHLNTWIDGQANSSLYKRWKYDSQTGKPVFAE